jgi:hypothetical protein
MRQVVDMIDKNNRKGGKKPNDFHASHVESVCSNAAGAAATIRGGRQKQSMNSVMTIM